MAVALDSDTVVGFLDRSDALHEAANKAVREYARTERLVVSAVTFAEVMTGARIDHHDEAIVAGFFDQVITDVLPVDLEVADRAATLRANHRSLKMPDALIAATADLAPAVEVLVTGDEAVSKLRRLGCRIKRINATRYFPGR